MTVGSESLFVAFSDEFMHFIYLDESGNTGQNLNDPEQPVFVLCAMIVPEDQWEQIDAQIEATIESHLGQELPDTFEIHAQQLRNGRGLFARVPLESRLALRSDLLQIAVDHQIRLVHRAIKKTRFKLWIESEFGHGVSINPHIAAFPLVATVVNEYLQGLPGRPRGIFISDENLEVSRDVEKSLKLLRGSAGTLRLSQILEKGFFIDSRRSLLLQLCDQCAYYLRKMEEVRFGPPAKPIDESAINVVSRLVHRGDEKLWDVLRWLTDQRRKGATRD